jgi:pimeloyl-ACP methyl ester carboxylesterase
MTGVQANYDNKKGRVMGRNLLATPVLLPGNMCDARMWTDTVRSTLFGAVDADLTQDDSIAAMASRTLAKISGPICPIGFSMGAIVAVEMAVQAPERVIAMGLIGYNATADLRERAAHRPLQQAAVRTGQLERILIEEMKPDYLAVANRDNGDLLALLLDMGMALGPDVFIRQSEALRLRSDRVAALEDIACPVMLICGREDRLCPPEWHKRWQSLLPNASLLMADTGHMLPLEKPSVLCDSFKDWHPTSVAD